MGIQQNQGSAFPAISDELACIICYEIIVDPVETLCCRQCSCSDCIKVWSKQRQTWPIDQKLLKKSDLKPPCRIVTNILNEIKITCKYKDLGCTEIATIENEERHYSGSVQCKYQPQKETSAKTQHNCNIL